MEQGQDPTGLMWQVRFSNSSPELESALRAYHNLVLTGAGVIPRQPGTTRRLHRLSNRDVADLVDAYNAGSTERALATKFGIHRHTVSQYLKAEHVRIRVKPLSPEQEARAIELYRDGWSLARVGQHLGCDAETIRQLLKRRGVPRRGAHERP